LLHLNRNNGRAVKTRRHERENIVTKLRYAAVLLAGVCAASCGEEGIATATWQAPRTEATPAQDPAALTTSLQAVVKDERVRSFYEARQWQAAWSQNQAASLEAAMKDAERHGINPERFQMLIASADNRAEYEASLTLAALSYADALAHGLVNPSEVHKIYTLPRNKVDVATGLATALQGGDVGNWLVSLAPNDAEYKALSDAYVQYSSRAEGGENAAIPTGGLIREGKHDPRVPAIADALQDLGYYHRTAAASVPTNAPAARQAQGAAPQQAAPAANTVFLPELSAAVKALQSEYGLKADGVVGNDTLELLNTGPADRARQLAVSMERRRWLERNPPATRVDVNTAATFLTYMKDGAKIWSTKVINGHSSTPTPNLGSTMFQLVANPPWHVPKSIAEEEIFPKGEGYLAENNMYVKDGQIIQRPGPGSALGEVKFDLKNDYAIYLHDTPSKKLFAQSQRHLSHGCVRVENPLEFARLIAEQNGKLEEFERALASRDTKAIALGTEIPVRLLYHTAYLDETGAVAFRPDAYGWDEDIAKALGIETGRTRFMVAVLAAPLGP
jgi:murein L,D-transpeptidase YcbB/YkuD